LNPPAWKWGHRWPHFQAGFDKLVLFGCLMFTLFEISLEMPQFAWKWGHSWPYFQAGVRWIIWITLSNVLLSDQMADIQRRRIAMRRKMYEKSLERARVDERACIAMSQEERDASG
jgi:hypothetical protein